MKYDLLLHYGWFLQNFEKDFIQTNMHTTVFTKTNFTSKRAQKTI